VGVLSSGYVGDQPDAALLRCKLGGTRGVGSAVGVFVYTVHNVWLGFYVEVKVMETVLGRCSKQLRQKPWLCRPRAVGIGRDHRHVVLLQAQVAGPHASVVCQRVQQTCAVMSVAPPCCCATCCRCGTSQAPGSLAATLEVPLVYTPVYVHSAGCAL
jgi:hypothetical protein